MRLASSGLKSRSVSRKRALRRRRRAPARRRHRCQRAAEQDQQHHRHHDAGDHVDDHDLAPAQHREQRAGDQRRERVADIAAHAVDRDDQPFAVGIALRQQRDRGRVPEVVADADQRRAGQQQPVVVAEAHQQVGRADPEQGDRHQQALAADRIDEQAARDVGNGAGRWPGWSGSSRSGGSSSPSSFPISGRSR